MYHFALISTVAWIGARTIPGDSISYNVSTPFCDTLRPRFFEDWFLSWHRLSCDDVHASVRRAFDAWQYNAPIAFHEVRGAADVTLRARDVRDESWVAFAQRSIDGTTIIVVDDSECWYTDQEFCTTVRTHRNLLLSLSIGSWVSSVLTVVYLLVRPRSGMDAVARLVAWTLFLSAPVAFVGVLLPCVQCVDFVIAIEHEIGHALGLGHSDAPAQRCGCGPVARPCNDSVVDAIMNSVIYTRDRACLAQDDVDAVRTLYGGDCAQPAWCYQAASLAGMSRVSVSIVYSFLIAWALVALNNLCCARRHRAARQSRPRDLAPSRASTAPRARLPPPTRARSTRALPARPLSAMPARASRRATTGVAPRRRL